MMKRVFFYTGFHMEVFEFDRNILIGSLDFYDNEDGIAQLREYIQESVVAQSYMLVDLQDEDFRNELVPHVRGNDRKQMLQRLESKIFREIEYHNTLALGRVKDGRKDDQYLFSSLLNVEAIDKWMSIFSELNVPICGIWSVPYLSERVIRKLSIKEHNVLLFSRQMRSAIRETLFIEGKLVISRQAKLERRIRKDKSAETLATILASNVDVMHRFLINQRVLSYIDSLHVYAIVSDELIEKTREYCEDSNILKFNMVGIRKLISLFDIKNCERYEANTLFAYLCSLENTQQQQYLPVKHRVTYNNYRLNVIVRNMSVALSLIFVVLASFLLLNAKEYADTEESLHLRKATLIETHSRLYGDKQDQIDSAQLIRETVNLMQNIERENADTPHARFPELARVLDQPQFQRFDLQTMQWKKLNPEQLQTIASGYSDLSKIQTEEDSYSDNEFDGEYGFQSSLTLKGELNRDNLSYHQAVTLMDLFIEAISNLPDVATVHILAYPIDIRVSSKFSDRSGLQDVVGASDMLNKQFELRIIFSPSKPRENADELAVLQKN